VDFSSRHLSGRWFSGGSRSSDNVTVILRYEVVVLKCNYWVFSEIQQLRRNTLGWQYRVNKNVFVFNGRYSYMCIAVSGLYMTLKRVRYINRSPVIERRSSNAISILWCYNIHVRARYAWKSKISKITKRQRVRTTVLIYFRRKHSVQCPCERIYGVRFRLWLLKKNDRENHGELEIRW
jgi:hypothetical protein